jgi:hypothetical protein
MALRVVQWTTGNVGKRSVRAVVARPDLELVGCYAWSGDKVGRDVGELCGIDATGITATADIDGILALKPDCVVYNPMWPDTDELVRLLEAGVNVVSTAAFIDGSGLGTDRDRIEQACERGGSSMFGTGISPGFVELIGIAAAGICDRVDKVTIDEASDTTLYDSPETERPAGFGRPIDTPSCPRWPPGERRSSGRPWPWSPTPIEHAPQQVDVAAGRKPLEEALADDGDPVGDAAGLEGCARPLGGGG